MKLIKNGSFPDVFENIRLLRVVYKFRYLEDGARGLDAHRAILGFSGVTLHQQTLHTHTYALFSSKKGQNHSFLLAAVSLS